MDIVLFFMIITLRTRGGTWLDGRRPTAVWRQWSYITRRIQDAAAPRLNPFRGGVWDSVASPVRTDNPGGGDLESFAPSQKQMFFVFVSFALFLYFGFFGDHVATKFDYIRPLMLSIRPVMLHPIMTGLIGSMTGIYINLNQTWWQHGLFFFVFSSLICYF